MLASQGSPINIIKLRPALQVTWPVGHLCVYFRVWSRVVDGPSDLHVPKLLLYLSRDLGAISAVWPSASSGDVSWRRVHGFLAIPAWFCG
jgi:hypothetical protein